MPLLGREHAVLAAPEDRQTLREMAEGIAHLEDLAVHLVDVLVVEWREAGEHLIQQCAQCPPAYSVGTQ